MLGMLRRHEVEILLKAGHPKTEAARLAGVSARSVHRIAEEAPVIHVDDSAERAQRHVGRPSIVEGFRKFVFDILKEKADLPSREVLRRVRDAGYRGGKTALYALVASLRPPLDGIRQEVFDWIRAVLQGALHRAALAKELGHGAELDRLLIAVRKGRLLQRNKAMVVLARERGIGQSHASSFLHVSKETAARYWKRYQRGGTEALFAKIGNNQKKSMDDGIKRAVFALLHSPPIPEDEGPSSVSKGFGLGQGYEDIRPGFSGTLRHCEWP
jgi:hypothetical protein